MTYTPIAQGTANWDVPVNAAFVDQDTRITNNSGSISSLQTSVSTNTSDITALQNLTGSLDWQPSDVGWKAWTQDPLNATGSATSVSGTVYFVRLILRSAATIDNLYVTVGAAGSGLTAGQNLVGLYTAAGVKVVEGADQTTAFGTTGLKTVAVTPTAVAAGHYFVAMMSNGATPANFMRGNSASSSALNALGVLRHINITAQTSLPASFTPGSANTDNNGRWAAVD